MFFILSSLFSSTELENRRVEQVFPGGVVPVEGRSGGKRVRRLNVVQKCVHMYINGNIIPNFLIS
jgi:hypothetical protein